MATIRERNGKWQAIVRIKRGGEIIFQESKTFSTEKLARTWAERMEAKITLDGAPAPTSDLTLAKLIEKYWTAMEEVKPLRRTRAGELSQLMATAPAAKRVSELTSEDFTNFARDRYQEGIAGPATIMHNLATFRSVLTSAKPIANIDGRPELVSEAVKLLRRSGHVSTSEWRDRRPTTAELEKLDKEFRRVWNHPDATIDMAKLVQLAVLWPRRREDFTNRLMWDRLDATTRTATLVDTKHPTKVRTEVVPVPDPAWEIIMSMPRVSDRVFPYNPESVSKAFARACERLGIVDLRFHDLRHEGVSRLFEMGLDMPEVAIISGHSWGMLRRYTHLRPSAVLEKINARFKEAQKAGAQSEKPGPDHLDHPNGQED